MQEKLLQHRKVENGLMEEVNCLRYMCHSVGSIRILGCTSMCTRGQAWPDGLSINFTGVHEIYVNKCIGVGYECLDCDIAGCINFLL